MGNGAAEWGCQVKTIPIKTILRQHMKAVRANYDIGDAINCARDGVMGTFIYVPELGNNPNFCAYSLETAAAHYEKQQGWEKDSPARAAFRDRIERYRQPLADLLALREEWQRESGLEALQTEQLTVMLAESKAWKEILGRLKAGKDTRAIAAYLGKNGSIIAPDKLRDVLRLIGKAGVK